MTTISASADEDKSYLEFMEYLKTNNVEDSLQSSTKSSSIPNE